MIYHPENNFTGQRSLMGYSPTGSKASDTTKQLSMCTRTRAHTHTHTHTHKHCVTGSHALKSVQEFKARPSACKSAVLGLVTQSWLTLCDPMGCSPPGSSVHRCSPGKNTGVGCYALLQRIFPTQGSNPGLLHCRWMFYHLSH